MYDRLDHPAGHELTQPHEHLVAVGQPAERLLHPRELGLEQLHIGEVVTHLGPPWGGVRQS
jgi:hypothetical protein